METPSSSIWTPGQNLPDGARASDWLRQQRQRERYRWRNVRDPRFDYQAAVTVDSAESGGTGHSSTTSPLTWSFNNVGGNLIIVSGVVTGKTSGTAAVSAVTYGAQALALVTSGSLAFDGVFSKVFMYFKATPLTGSNTVSVTWSHGGASVDAIWGATSFAGVNAATPMGTAVSATNNNGTATVDLAGTTAGNLVVDVMATGTLVSTVGALQTRRWLLNVSSGTGGDNAQTSTEPAGGTITMSHTVTSDLWAIVAAEIFAASGVFPAYRRPFPYRPGGPRFPGSGRF